MKKMRKPKDTSIERIEAIYASNGACRHCGGKIPCWSMAGDKVPLSAVVIAKAKAYLKRNGAA